MVNIILGILLLFLILPNRKGYIQNKLSKSLLIIIIFFNTHSQLDSFLYNNKYFNMEWYDISYLYYHLYGFLIFLFTQHMFKSEKKYRPITLIMIIYTIARIILYIVTYDVVDMSDIEDGYMPYVIDIGFALFINTLFLTLAYIKIKKVKFAVELSNIDKVNYIWLKRLIVISIVIYIAIIQNDIILAYRWDNLVLHTKIESTIQGTFFIAMSYFAIRFPLFSLYGDFKDDTHIKKDKYASSTLKPDISDKLWNDIQHAVKEDKGYMNPEYRLNDLAKSVDRSLHNVSQVINERTGKSFSDFINKYRVEYAKELLLDDNNRNFTILAIAYEVGFNSKTSFYNSFKKETGVTPTQFKKDNTKTH